MGFGPAVINKDEKKSLHHISASQVNTYEACPHRWYEEKVNGAPSFADWSWAEAGVAAHEILEEQVGAVIGKTFNESKRRVLDPKVVEEAEELVAWFNWEDYFEEHQIVDVEMDMVLNLNIIEDEDGEDDNKDYPLFVGSMDVVSLNKDGVTVITDWKTGYGSDKGVDIQAQAYALGLMQIMGLTQVIFRRIYPRLPGEVRGVKKVEEYYFNEDDTKRYLKRIKHLAQKMGRTVSGEISPKVTASDSCVHCPVAYNCPIAKDAAFEPKELASKRKVLKAALGQVDNAMKKVADNGDFFVGDERYGYTVSEFYRSRQVRSDDVATLLTKDCMDFLSNTSENSKSEETKSEIAIIKEKLSLLLSKAKVSIDDEVKEALEAQVDGAEFKLTARKSFKFLNEKELKDAAKAEKKKQSTVAEVESAKSA